jgi:hypothetical protein
MGERLSLLHAMCVVRLIMLPGPRINLEKLEMLEKVGTVWIHRHFALMRDCWKRAGYAGKGLDMLEKGWLRRTRWNGRCRSYPTVRIEPS